MTIHLHIRSLRDGDERLVQQVFDAMSPDSRYLRFHAATPRLTRGALDVLSRVDPGRREGAVALVGERAVGIGQWARTEPAGDRAELAMMVVDALHGRGIGHALLAHLSSSAARHRVRHFSCWVHPANAAVQHALRRLGASDGDDGPHERLLAVGQTWPEGSRERHLPAPQRRPDVVALSGGVRRTRPTAGG